MMTQTNICEQKLLGPTVFVPKALTKYVTKNAAALLQQLHYSLQNSKFTQYGERWVCRTLETWAEILGCAPRTIQRAFESLESLGLVISDRLHTHMYNQIKSYRVDYEVLETFLADSTNCLSIPRQSVVVEVDSLSTSNNKNLNTDLKKQQTGEIHLTEAQSFPTHHPVFQIDKEKILGDPSQICKELSEDSLENPQVPGNQESQLEFELEQEITETVGHKLSAGLKMLVIQTSSDVIKDALTIVRTTKEPKNKAGLFRRAIENQWKPSGAAKSEKKFRLDPDFDEWWGYAKQLGLVIGSELVDDEFWIYAAPAGTPCLYGEMRAMFSMNWLKKRIKS